ncbi:uncharacterized protein K02A2.6-like [Sycon ciliatum]|uniref:uncharacterized protein K02A2.6-like n=1 Tax=Sycon ciliatum TaxID=27933 RepID=UPI0031F6BE80
MTKGRTPKEFIPDYAASNVGADFELWLEDINDFLSISEVTAAADKKRLFLNLAGLAVRRIVKGLVVTVEQTQDGSPGDEYQALTDALLAHFRPSTNVTSERHKFRQLRQMEGESVTSFVGRLREKADVCEFSSTSVDTIVNCQIRDQLIVGLRSVELRKELLKQSKLTLNDAVTKSVALEASITDSKLYDSTRASDTPPVFPVPIQRVQAVSAAGSGSEGKKCKYCGRSHKPGMRNCPAANVTCNKCGKRGHFAAVCMSNKVERHEERARPVEDEPDEYEHASRMYDSAFAVSSSALAGDKTFQTTLKVNGELCTGLLDTGATRTILTDDVIKPTRKSDRLLKAYNGGVVETLGMADVHISHGGKNVKCSCFVVAASQHSVLFGQDVIKELNLLSQAYVVNVSPIEISLEDGSKPLAQPPRRPAFSIRADIETELKRLTKLDIIEPVKEATPWVSPLVPVRKPNGALRLCVDYRELNKRVTRERNVLPTVDEITAQLDGAGVFSVLDAESGFHQLLLSEEARPLTTFSSHCGLFRFKRLPFGIACAPEIFQRVVSDILEGLPGVIVYIDDILVFGSNQAEHDARLEAVKQRLRAANLQLNWTKCRLNQDRVKYLGHWLSATGLSPDDDKLQAIQELAPPKSISDVRRFLGMATYLGKFIPNLAQITASLRRLAKRDPFSVDDEVLQAFTSAKAGIASALQALAFFQPALDVPTAISCDASPDGLGAVLWQKNTSGCWVPVTCASRSLSDVESRYSQLEREMLGVVFGLTRFRQYVLGREVQVFTDHKPLISIVQKPFDEVPPRLQRWLVALMPYRYSLVFVPGQQMVCADTLSRAPLPDRTASPAEARSMAEFVSLILEACPVRSKDIRQATDSDPTLSSVRQRVGTSVWSGCIQTEEPYFLLRHQLTVIEGIVMLDNRYVIPEELRPAVLRLAHEGHPGIDAFRDTLRERVWWPGLMKDANLFAEKCSECWRKRSNPAQQLLPTEIEGVWQKLAIDLVTIEGATFLSAIDYGSRWPELLPLSNTTTTGVIDKLMELFARFGLPSTLVSDWGPQFASTEMSKFLAQLGVEHCKSSPRYARSNGMVERLHRLVKERVASLRPHLPLHRRITQVLFDIRNSRHRMLGTSPSEALFSRVIRTRVPASITPQIVNPSEQIKAKAAMVEGHDSRRGVRKLPHLPSGTRVVLHDGYSDPRKEWKVVEQYGRQVGVTDGSRILLRNRQHVTEFVAPAAAAAEKAPMSEPPAQSEREHVPEPVCAPALPVSDPTSLPSASSATSRPEAPLTALTLPLSPAASPETTASPATPACMSLSPPTSRPSVFREGVQTRAGRQIKLTEKAREADI